MPTTSWREGGAAKEQKSTILQALQLAISIIMGQQHLLARDNSKARDMDEQGTAKKIGEKSKEREEQGTGT